MHCSIGQELGVEITTGGPLLMIGVNFEHAGDIEFNFTGARNVVATVLQTEGETMSMLLNDTATVSIFGTLFGSGTGHGNNHTLRATRGAGACVQAITNGAAAAPVAALDLSYRILGSMQRYQPILLIDDDFSVPGNSSEWMCAAFLKAC